MRLRELITTGVVAGLVALGLAYAGAPVEVLRRAASTRVPAFEGRAATVDVSVGAGRIALRSKDGAFAREVELSLVVDGVVRPVVWKAEQGGDAGITAAAAMVALEETSVGCTLTFTFDPGLDALTVGLAVDGGAGHTFALRGELASEGASAFVSGVGHVADRASVRGPVLVVESTPHPFGVSSSAGPLSCSRSSTTRRIRGSRCAWR
jgi:hypothetical protein